MDDDWGEIFDKLDWDSVDKEIEKSKAETSARDDLIEYFWKDDFDYKRSYVREIMASHPEITDRYKIDAASEQMKESHDGGVELGVEDALRFVANDKPVPISELVKSLTDAGIHDGNIVDVLSKSVGGGEYGAEKNAGAKRKARLMTRYADFLARNADVVILGLPVFDPESDWTQVKLAFFSENLNAGEQAALNELKGLADKSKVKVEHGVAVVVFKLYNIWDTYI